MGSDNTWFWCSKEIDKARLSVHEFRVLAHLAARGGSGKGCTRGVLAIAEACLIDRKTVRNVIKTLRERGFVEKVDRPGDSSVLKIKVAAAAEPDLNAAVLKSEARSAALDSREVEVPQDGMTRRTFRSMPITRATLLQLPLLVSLSVVSEITGLSFRDISEEVRSGRMRTYKCRAGGQNKYFRADMFALAGLSICADDMRPAKNGANGSNPCPAGSTFGSPGLTPPAA